MRTLLLTLAVLLQAGTARAIDFSHQELARGRFQTSMPDALAPEVFPRAGRYGFLEGNERFRLQDDQNYFALVGDLSMYLETNANSYQALPNELYLDAAPHPVAGLYVGRRKLLFGSGMAANPTDWLNAAKDPLNPQSQRVGAYMAAAEARTENIVVTALFAPQVTANDRGLPDHVQWDSHLILARLYILAAETDINVLAGYDQEVPRAGASFSRYVFDILEVHGEAAARRGSPRQTFDRRYVSFLKTADWSKMPASTAPPPFMDQPDIDSNQWFTQALAGTRWMSSDGDLVSLEYLWNREGLDRNEWDSRMAILAVLPAGLLMHGQSDDPARQFSFQPSRRNYLFLNASRAQLYRDSWLEDFSANLAVAANLDHRPSALIYPSLTLKRGQNVGFTAGMAVPTGPPESEFGSLPIREMYIFEITAYL